MKLFSQLTAVCLTVALTVGLVNLGLAAGTAVDLGSASSFAVLADTAITDASPPTGIITGDVGLGPTSGGASITGLTSVQVSGTIYAMDAAGPDGPAGDNPAVVGTAKDDLVAAYNDANGQAPDTLVDDGTLGGGETLTPGVYSEDNTPDSLAITGNLILDGGGNPNAVFVFQSDSTLVTAADSTITLINGAQACNVFWQVGSSATLGTNSSFVGTVLALTSITDNGGSTVEGRLLARNGAVSLNDTTIVTAACVAPPSGGSSNSSVAQPFPLINVTKVPDPLALASGSGSVTFTYVVTNIGLIAMREIQVTDNKCGAVQYISGDTDGDSMLDLDEAWTYTCTKTVNTTETNTVTAEGRTSNALVRDTANATVVVGASILPPLIHLVKRPSVFVLPAGGGAVTYSYTVTNPGTEPLDNVSVIDDKCTGLPGRVLGHPGDLNDNDLLESNESWSFTCQSTLSGTTTNTGTAEGHANGLTALDYALTTVVVAPASTPSFPATGFGGISLWDIAAKYLS